MLSTSPFIHCSTFSRLALVSATCTGVALLQKALISVASNTTNYTFSSVMPIDKSKCGPRALFDVDDEAILWLKNMVTTALAKRTTWNLGLLPHFRDQRFFYCSFLPCYFLLWLHVVDYASCQSASAHMIISAYCIAILNIRNSEEFGS